MHAAQTIRSMVKVQEAECATDGHSHDPDAAHGRIVDYVEPECSVLFCANIASLRTRSATMADLPGTVAFQEHQLAEAHHDLFQRTMLTRHKVQKSVNNVAGQPPSLEIFSHACSRMKWVSPSSEKLGKTDG